MSEHDNKWSEYGETRLLSRNKLTFLHHRLMNEYFLDLVRDLDVDSRVLDVGCGEGLYLELLRGLGFRNISGIDPSDAMVSKALEKNLSVEKKYLQDVKEKEIYDVVVMIDILEHLDDPGAALQKVNEILKKGGLLLMNMPVCDSLKLRLRRTLYKETRLQQAKRWDETHVWGFTKKSVEEMLKERSFRVVKMQRISNSLPGIDMFKKQSKFINFLQSVTFFGLFGDLLTVTAKKE
ncbi:MAG: class I SAM-dependent methyltransferase [Candidatus Omnitrophota bacterium]